MLPVEILDCVVTVCDHCYHAACWQGNFFCDDIQGAGTVDKTIRELLTYDHDGEHPQYWLKDLERTGRFPEGYSFEDDPRWVLHTPQGEIDTGVDSEREERWKAERTAAEAARG